MKKFQELVYTRPNFEEINKQIDQLVVTINHSKDEASFMKAFCEFNALYNDYSTQTMIAYVRSLSDSSNKMLYEEMEYTFSNATSVHTDLVYNALLKSPYKRALINMYGEYYLHLLENEIKLTSNGEELLKRESEINACINNIMPSIKVTYEGEELSSAKLKTFLNSTDAKVRADSYTAKLEAYLSKKEEFDSIIDELVHLRDKLAKANGFNNYLEYINMSKNRYSYGEREMQEFCDTVVRKFSPLIIHINERLQKRLGLEKYTNCDTQIIFPEGNVKPLGDVHTLIENAQKMYDDMDSYFGLLFKDMVEKGYFDIEISDNKVTNMGFTTTLLSEKAPYIFSNYTCDGVSFSTVMHEFGHASQFAISMEHYDVEMLHDLPQDACEIPSKTMELLIMNYLDLFFGDEQHKYKEEHLIKMLREICDYCMIHEFETYLYTCIDVSPQDRIDKFNELTKKYSFGVERIGQDLLKNGASLYANMITFNFPRYLISYSICDISAFAIAELYHQDKKKGIEVFKNLAKIGGTKDYNDAMKAIGLPSAFSEEAIDYAVDYFKRELEL